jgi:diketogulonate reductase-like aldo/keto reductase
MPTVELGRTGLKATRYGLGGFHQIEISSEVVRSVVDAYLAAGGNYVETARGYGGGASEEKLGRALAGRRDRVILCSKTGAATADDARRDLDASLKALRTDRIDLHFFHAVGRAKLERITAPGGAVEGLAKARDEGLIGGLGLTSHDLPAYLDAFGRIDLDVILIWCNYLDNLNLPIIPERIIPAAKDRHIAVTAMKPLADGFLHRSVQPAMRYCLAAGADVAVCGTNSPEQVRAAAAAVANGPADADEMAATLRDAPELGRYVCRRCGACPPELMDTFRLEGEFDRQMVDFLPHGAAEAALRKVLCHWFGKQDAAREAFAAAGYQADGLPAAAAEVDCPYGIDVPRKARIATAKLTRARPEVL